MEQQFIAATEKAPRLELLEAGHSQKFLVLNDSYVHRNILGGETVAMASCLEKDDLLELLEETEDEVLIELPVAEGPRPGRNEVGKALAAEEAPAGGEGPDNDDLLGLVSDDSSDDEKEGAGVKMNRLKRYIRLSTEHVRAMLVHHLGPASVGESLMIVKRLKMNKEDVSFSNNRLATAYLCEWKVALEWCAVYLPREKLMVRAFLKGVQPVNLSQSLENEGHRSMEGLLASF